MKKKLKYSPVLKEYDNLKKALLLINIFTIITIIVCVFLGCFFKSTFFIVLSGLMFIFSIALNQKK